MKRRGALRAAGMAALLVGGLFLAGCHWNVPEPSSPVEDGPIDLSLLSVNPDLRTAIEDVMTRTEAETVSSITMLDLNPVRRAMADGYSSYLEIADYRINSLLGIEQFYWLKEIDVTGNRNLSRLDLLASLPNIERIVASDISKTSVVNISGLGSLPMLDTLILHDSGVTDVSGLAASHRLRVLNLSRTPVSIGVNSLVEVESLRYLDLRNTPLLPGEQVSYLRIHRPEVEVLWP